MKKILIVDDENEVREIIYSLLEDYIDLDEVELFEAGSFEMAVELINNNHFNLVVTDLCLSGAGGNDLINFIRNTARHKIGKTGIEIAEIALEKSKGETKLIAVTGLAELIDYSDKFIMFDKILEKPFRSDFAETVMKLLDD